MSTLHPQNLEALKQRLAQHPPHLQMILNGAAVSFADASNPLRFSNTATGLRELLRELFASISPDQSIKRCSWFTTDSRSKTGITRRHRILFAVYSYLNPAHFPANFLAGIETLATLIAKQVGDLSRFTHVTKASLETPEQTANACFDSTLGLFLRLFEAVDSGREHLLDTLGIELQQHLADMFTSDFFDELDMLSSHTRPQDAEDIRVEIDDIGEQTITFSGTGSVFCNLQYGSDGDCRRGDGLEWCDSFPFTFSGEARTANPYEVTVDPGDISVDTSSFWDESGCQPSDAP